MELDELIRRFVVEGDGAAMDELVRATRPALLRVARRIGAPQDADDAVQAAYLALVRRGAKPLESPVLPWLLTAVVRIAYRNKAVAKRRVAAAKRLSDWTDETPLDETIRRDEALALRREVTRLPPDYRDALVLHYLEGLPVDDVAALLEISPSAVKMRLLRGRALLRSRLGVRLGRSLLWLPWALSDAGAAVLGGAVMKKLAVAGVLALVAGTFVAARHLERNEPVARAAPPARTEPVATVAADAPGGPTTDAAFLSGRVVDETGAPMSDVGVFVRQYDAEPPGTRTMPFFYPCETEPQIRSDATGAFAVADAVDRFESFWLVRRGYEAVQIRGGRGVLTGLEVTLRRARQAEGSILDTEGRPIPGARVFFGMLTVHADDHGRYALDILPPPPWPIRVGAPGYESGESTEAGEIRLRRAVVIAEPVDPRTGAPVVEARGMLVLARSGAVAAALVPKWDHDVADVRYPPGRICAFGMRFAESGPSEADLHVFAPGHVPFCARLRLEPGAEPPHVVAEMAKGDGEPVLAGRVEGAPRATIEIRQADRPHETRSDEHRPLLQTVETAKDGSFAVAGLPHGRYRVIALSGGRGVVAKDIDLPALDVVIAMSVSASLAVVGIDGSGAAVAGAWIHLEAADSGRAWEERTDTDGRAFFPDLPAGKLLLCPARFHGFSARNRRVPLEEFELAPGQAAEREVLVPVERGVVLTVADAEGRPIPGIAVALRPEAGFGREMHAEPSYRPQGETDTRGQIRFPLYPGLYEATIVRDGVTHTPRFEVGREPFATIVLGDVSVLRGTVVDAVTGEPVGPIAVRAYANKGRVDSTFTSKADGRFALPCAASGTAKLAVSPLETPAGNDPRTPYPYLLRGEIDLPRGELRVALPRVRGEGADLPVAVEILVTDAETGAALDGANVSCEALLDGWWMSVTGWIPTGADGRATGRIVRGDAYRVIAAGPWDGPIEYVHKQIECAATGTIRVEAALVKSEKGNETR